MIGNSVVYYGPKDVRIEPFTKIPKINDGEVLLKIEGCAVCGSDMKTYNVGNPRMRPPTILGHELSGEIVEIGNRVNNYNVGQRVTLTTSIGCGECVYCKSGRTNLCRSLKAMGFHYNGAMAPYMVVPQLAVKQNHLVDIGDLDTELAILSEPLSCVINDLSRPNKEDINSALILGLGPLGMLHAVTARGLGINKVICVEFPGKRMDIAKKSGFEVIHPDEIEKSYKQLSGGEGFDIVIITAPVNAVQSKAPVFAKKGGYISYFASLPVGNEMLNINSRTIHYNELILYGTSDSTVKHVKMAVEMLKNHSEDFRPMVTHKLKLEDFFKAIDLMQSGEAVKVMLS